MTEPGAPLWPLIGAGWTALVRYTGTLLVLFVVQLVLTGAALFGMAQLLASVFAQSPYFDRAVDLDLAAALYFLRNHREVLLAAGWIGLGAVLIWQVGSWFLTAGMMGVLAARPEGRADTARCFGAAGAAGFLPFLGLALASLPAYVLVSLVLGLGLDVVSARVAYSPTLGHLLGYLAAGTAPALLLLLATWTATDYARAELVLRRDSHDLSVLAAYGRAWAFVLTRPRALLHTSLGWLLVAGVAIGYAVAAADHPMAGTRGALALFVVRQGVVLVQLAIRFGVIGGVIALSRQRPLPPDRRRDEP